MDTLNGRLTFNSKQWLIGKYLYVKRSHEEQETGRVIRLLVEEGYIRAATEDDGAALNVGANIGMTCIRLVKEGVARRAIAFEPCPENCRLLVHNIEQNGLKNRIECFPFALSSVDGDMDLELSPDNSGDHRIRQTAAPGFFEEEKRRTIRVQARTFDQFFRVHQTSVATRITLVWVDIQGHEGQFFQGARQLLSRRTPVPVVSEFWPYGILRSGLSKSDFCEIVVELFECFYVVTDGPAQRRPVGEIESLFERYRSPREFCTLVLVSRSLG